MNEQKSMVFVLSRNVIIILLFALLIGLLMVQSKIGFFLGILFGGIITILKIVLMDNTLRNAMRKPPHVAANYVRGHYFLRFLITFVVLFIGVYTPSIDFIGLVIGLLALKPAAYIQGHLEPQVPKDGSVEFLEWEEEDEDEKSDFW